MEKEILINFCEQGFSISKIAFELKKSKSTIRYWLSKFDINTKNLNSKEKSKIKKNDKKCSRCNFTKPIIEFYKRRRGTDISPYCKICTKNQTLERQRKIKTQCVEYKGGKCIICNYNKYIGALDFHHLDPSKKDFSIGKLKNYSFSDKIKNELNKCILVCANCHREIHAKLIVAPQGIEP